MIYLIVCGWMTVPYAKLLPHHIMNLRFIKKKFFERDRGIWRKKEEERGKEKKFTQACNVNYAFGIFLKKRI